MEHTLGARHAAPGARSLVIALVLAVLALGAWTTKGPVQQASATNFCTEWTLQPFGHNGDRCDAGPGSWGRLMTATVQTFQRAGCVNYHGWYGEYYRSWACFPNNSNGYMVIAHDGGSYIPIIRNNNLSYSGKFSGAYQCCWVE